MLLDNWLAQRAETCPDRLAVRSDGVDLDYAELELEAASTARRLAAHGVRRDAVVALELEPGPHYATVLHGLMKLGAIAYPVNTRLEDAERRQELRGIDAALVLGSELELTATEADMPLLGEHDLNAIHCRLSTSGTSGRPRSVGLTYGNFLWSAVGSAFNLGVDPADRWLCCLPLYHVAGLSILMRSVIYGTGAVIHDGFDPDRIAESLAEDEVTLFSLVTTQLVRLLEAGVDLSGPRAIVVGGGPVPVDVIEEATGRGATVV
jgi:o-succinylbenzoate---CoA ligase